jgi:hypothetical protein
VEAHLSSLEVLVTLKTIPYPLVRRRRPVGMLSSLAATLVVSAVAACYSGGPTSGAAGAPGSSSNPTGNGPLPFQADPPSVYVAKVKDILVGLPPSDSEVSQVVADPSQLGNLIDQWTQLPEYQTKMIRFFELAFQQTQITSTDFTDQAYPKQIAINPSTTPLLVQNAQESFARTMLALVEQGQPLTVGLTTNQLMMTTAMKVLYGFLDAWQVDDQSRVVDRFRAANPNLTITVEASQGPIPLSETLDPTSPNYMHWYDPDVTTANAQIAGCQSDPIVYPASASTLQYLLFGSLDGRKNSAGTNCPPFAGTATAPQLTASDFSDWTMVTIRQPNPGEAATTFYDLATLRQANELILTIPRIGFFSTPAFFANWQTNMSNQMRVTMNQTFIVATGAQVDGTDKTVPSSTPGLDTAHASQPACFSCHQLLDPSRSILQATYSWNYHDQTDPTQAAQKGLFAFQGVIANVGSVNDLAKTLANHPLFAQAWVQKLCYYANSAPCLTTDPEFQRVVGVFQSSGYSWNALVKELLSSPLTTNATETLTTQTDGEVVAVSRRDHICAAWNARLGFQDVCGLNVGLGRRPSQQTIPEIVSGLPSDGYGRGSVAPVLPNSPTLFFRAGTENICEGIAEQVIDPPAGQKQQAGPATTWSSSQPNSAINDFVSLVMGLPPSDARSQPAAALLTQHFQSAVQQGASASDALKSTFVTACLAPSAVSIGM